MDIVSLCPLPASGFVWQPHAGGFAQTVLVKATFVLRPGESVLAPDQDPLHKEDKHWDNAPTRSVYAPSDWAPFKPKADVMLVGHAFAPGQQPVRSLMVRLVVGELDKSIEVWCDRGFRVQDGQLLEGPRFTKQALAWERAAGGPETNNPVGMRFDAAPDMYGMVAVPNLQPPGMFVSQRSDTFPPVCFAPVAERWPERVTRLGSAAGAFAAKDWEGRPLPEGFSYAYFQAAPGDQHVRELRANERLVLENLHTDHERLVTSLPGIKPKAVAERLTGEREDVALVADTLWIDTDRAICTLVWRGRIGLRHAMEAGRIAVSVDPSSIEAATAGGLKRKVTPPKDDAVQTLAPEFVELDVGEDVSTITIAPALGAALGSARALPFARDEARSGTPQVPSTPALKDNSGVLPFGREAGSVGPVQAPIPPPVSMAAQGTMFVPPSLGAPVSPIAPPSALAPIPPGGPAAVSSAPSPPPLFIAESAARPAAAPPAVDIKSPWASGPPRTDDRPPPALSPAAAAASAGEPEGPGVVRMSNAAAAKSEWRSPRPDGVDPEPSQGANAAVARPTAARGTDPRDALSLIWFDPQHVRRLRKHKPFRQILTKAESKPPDADLDEAPVGDLPVEVEDRRDVFEILTNASSIDAPGVTEALDRSIREDGKVVPPLVLCAGELFMPFDEVEELKATVATVTPLSTGDENLKSSLQIAKEFLGLPNLASAPAVAEGLVKRIYDAFGQGKRAVTPDYIKAQVERALLEQRYYQRRKVFGGKQLRGLLVAIGGKDPIPTYLPDAVSEELPMYARFRVRLIAEVRLGEDQYESHPAALKVLALGRVIERVRR